MGIFSLGQNEQLLGLLNGGRTSFDLFEGTRRQYLGLYKLLLHIGNCNIIGCQSLTSQNSYFIVADVSEATLDIICV